MKKIILIQIICCVILIILAFVFRYTDIGGPDMWKRASEVIKDSVLIHRIEDDIARAASYVLLYIK